MLEIEFDSNDVAVVVTFLLCFALCGIGRALQPRFGAGHEYFPFLMTGFESGMLGISLFGSAYGLSHVGYFAVVDLGHELFIWFFFLALLLAKRDGIQSPGRLFGAFIRSPVIIAIIAGIVASLAGLRDALYDGPIVGGVMNTLVFLAALIAVVIDPGDPQRSAVFSRRLDETIVDLVMVDAQFVDTVTGMVFDPFLGLARSGPLADQDLNKLPAFTAFPFDFDTFFPDGRTWPS